MVRTRRKIIIGVAFLFILAVFAYWSLGRLVESSIFREWIQTEITNRTGYELKIGRLSLQRWFRFEALEIVVSRPGEVLFQVNRAHLTLTPVDLFFKRISRLSLDRPVLEVRRMDLFGSSKKTSANLVIPSIRIFEVQDGVIVLDTAGQDKLAVRSISLNVKNLNLGQETGLRIQAYFPGSMGMPFSPCRDPPNKLSKVS